MAKLIISEKNTIIDTKGSRYRDIVYDAVKTTGIFCHPSCSARTPKSENVSFYNSTKEAL